ncbi:MAG TPA: sialidase family protein [Mycobacteriales bacterium]|nr:sialidase family protein [Mycobacteriales bacterium]
MRRLLAISAALPVIMLLQPVLAAGRPATPAFTSYEPPPTEGGVAGEPTLGYNPETGAVMFQANLETLRVTDFDKRGRGTSTWTDVSPGLANTTTLDPIIETDRVTGRHIVSHLALACSLSAYSDDDGASWTEVPLGCGAGAMFDHQTVGTGPFVEGGVLRPTGSYPHAAYYCAQDVTAAKCSTSLDGGATYLPAVTVYTAGPATNCSGLFGHLKSAPDGTVYLPPTQCERGITSIAGQPSNPLNRPSAATAVSEDNGLTWELRYVPGSLAGNAGHPSLDVGSDGSVYFAWGGREGGKRTDEGGPPMAAVSRDKGRTWTKPAQLGREFGIRNTKFVTTVAGDGDRAAVAFLGTPTPGNDQVHSFEGVWRLYVAFTYDAGRTWKTVNATPRSPIQVGSICTSGVLCMGNTRNLLDFNDVIIDGKGRVLAAVADGCLDVECSRNERARRALIVRQTKGRGLLRAFDRELARAR